MVLPVRNQCAPEINQTANWHNLPKDTLIEIFSYLKPHERTGASAACKRWNALHVTCVKSSLVGALESTVDDVVDAFYAEQKEILGVSDDRKESIDPDSISKIDLGNLPPELSHFPDLLLAVQSKDLNRIQCAYDSFQEKAIAEGVKVFEAIKPKQDSYHYTTRRPTKSKQAIEELSQCYVTHLQLFRSPERESSLSRIESAFINVARTLPTFESLRNAPSLSKVRQEFGENIKSLLDKGSHNFHKDDNVHSVAFPLIKRLIESREEYVIGDVLNDALLDLDSFRCRYCTHILPSLTTTKTALLLSTQIANKGFNIQPPPNNSAENRLEELIKSNQFTKNKALGLYRDYKLYQAADQVVDCLIQQKRYAEIVDLFQNTGIAGVSQKCASVIEAMIQDKKLKKAFKVICAMDRNLRTNIFQDAHQKALLSDLVKESAKRLAILFVRSNLKTEALRLAHIASGKPLEILLELPYPENLTLFRWIKEEHKEVLDVFRWDLYGEIQQVTIKCFSQKLLQGRHHEEAFEVAESLWGPWGRHEMFWSIASEHAKIGNLRRAIQIASRTIPHSSTITRLFKTAKITLQLAFTMFSKPVQFS